MPKNLKYSLPVWAFSLKGRTELVVDSRNLVVYAPERILPGKETAWIERCLSQYRYVEGLDFHKHAKVAPEASEVKYYLPLETVEELLIYEDFPLQKEIHSYLKSIQRIYEGGPRTTLAEKVPIEFTEIEGVIQPTVRASDLCLGIWDEEDFQIWTANFLDDHNFVEGRDYVVTPAIHLNQRIECHLTLDTALAFAVKESSPRFFQELRTHFNTATAEPSLTPAQIDEQGDLSEDDVNQKLAEAGFQVFDPVLGWLPTEAGLEWSRKARLA